MTWFRILAILPILAVFIPARARAAEPSREEAEFFEKNVRPVLAEHCFSCHGPNKQRAGVRLDSRQAMLLGGDTGPILVPGHPEKSTLVQVIEQKDLVKMPPKGKLSPEAIAALTAWVKGGAPWPGSATPAGEPTGPMTVAEARKRHWSFQPVHLPAPAKVRNPGWIETPVDSFILARLESKGLNPAAPAGRHTLIRRVTFDLTGLPPTPEEVNAFVNDPSPDAFAKVVDRLLASPRYGERWGRHWLDVARYADTKGYVFQEERRFPASYTYRDYVIRSFNQDRPYDRFLVEQLAADQLDLGDDQRPLAAMGYLTLGRRFLNNTPDIIDDRIDVVMRGMQALTVTCARCHNHKYDPIPQRDYYSLYGVFASSTEPRTLPEITTPDPSPEYADYQKQLAKLQQAVSDFKQAHARELRARNRKFRDQLRRLQKKVDQLKVTHPGAPPRAMVLEDARHPVEPVVFLRGNPRNPGPHVPRQFLEVLAGEDRQPFHKGSGRLELAQAIASKDNPLTARVMVNRIWMHHFGAGLVRTPSDFGARGDEPTHPQLLDYLAATFMEQGWSIKQVQRLILLSATYQQSTIADVHAQSLDPENRLLSHFPRQRLEYEPLRDALLAVAGTLDSRIGGRPVDLFKRPFATRRTVYGFIDRQNLPPTLRTFDFANPDSTSPGRHHTTVPQQSLFLMNSPFVVEQARALAAREDLLAHRTVEERIDFLYRLLYARRPDARELDLGKQFLAANPPSPDGQNLSAWEKYCQVLLLANEFTFLD
jgi:cytochrome c553